METGLEEYRAQIENWMESVCEISFGYPIPSESKSQDM
jgi:hypothetical protein